MSDEPLDALETAVGDPVTVQLKDGTTYHGSLSAFDRHMNLVLEVPEHADRDADAHDDRDGDRDDDRNADRDGDRDADSNDDSDAGHDPGPGVETVDNTTVIRGDNVVSIES